LGPLLRERLLDVLRLLDKTPAPRGEERTAAHRLRAWCADRWPQVEWRVLEHGHSGASLTASHGTGPLLYSHLDTSLDDGSRGTWLVTGSAAPAGPLDVCGDVVSGFGLGVARGPAAAALVAFAGAGAGRLLLAGSGTHRRGGGITGLEAYADAHPLPRSAIVAKSGPPFLLWEEPGAFFLTVRVTGRPGLAMLADAASPPGGVIASAGVVLDELARWRAAYLAADPRTGQAGRACGIGAVEGGWPDKPDLLPAELRIALYLVAGDPVEPKELAAELAGRLRARCAESALRECEVGVEAEPVAPAAATPADAPVVRAARAAWLDEFGEVPPPVTGWTGSTDGIVLRARGVDTVRLGPRAQPAAGDPRRDELSLDGLAAYARVYRRLLTEAPG
jgi:acetylornithine deacetylase/succinyl-diaminopimelate desuccinylase-like protein